MTTGLWSIIATTDFMSRAILFLLLCMSIACWALAFYKRMEINAKIKSLKQAKGLFNKTKGMDDFLGRVSVIQTTFAGELVTSFLGDFKKLLRSYDSSSGVVADRDWYLLQSSVNMRVDEALAQEESLLPLLSTAAAASPLLGLFGTVWGLIHAFMAIAEQHSADIAAVAPGIAEALIATLGGLVVAIPALAMYVYLQGRVKLLEQEVIELSDTCLWVMRGVLATDSFISNSATKSSSMVQELQ